MRIRRWLREWLHLMFIGERWLKTIARLGAYLTALLIALWPLPTPSVEFFIGTSTLILVDRTISVGALLSAGFFVLIAIYTAGLAWDRSLSPRIGIGREPIVDIDSRCFRLPIHNVGVGLVEPEVSIIEIFDENEQTLDTTGAFELQWTNHPPGVRAKISRDDEKTVNLVCVHRGNLLFEGVNHKRDVLTSSRGLLPDRVFFVVRAKIPGGAGYEEALFSIRADESRPLRHLVSLEKGPYQGSRGHRAVTNRRPPRPGRELMAADVGSPPMQRRRFWWPR